MLTEIEYAVNYWTFQVFGPQPQDDICYAFADSLSISMHEKFEGHWHCESPERGQAFREIVCDFENGFVDPLLNKAAIHCGFILLPHMFRSTRMWVDPGFVEVADVKRPRRSQVLYSADNLPDISLFQPSYSPLYYNPEMDFNNSNWSVPAAAYEYQSSTAHLYTKSTSSISVN